MDSSPKGRSLREAAAARRRKRREAASADAAAPEAAAPEDAPEDAAPSEPAHDEKRAEPLDLENPYAPPRASLDLGPVVKKQRAPVFAVPTGKMVVMIITTCGLYELYWIYKNWQVALREGREVSPLGRTFFSAIFAYPLFKRIRDEALGAGVQTSLSPLLLTILFIFGHVFWQVPGAMGWLAFLGLVPTIAANATARATLDALGVGPQEDDKFTAWNIIAATLGGILLLVSLAARS